MRRVIPFVLLFTLPIRAAVDPPKVEEFAPHASGVALAEVVAIKKYDERPSDGNAGIRFKLKLVRGSGELPGEVDVVTEHGGLRPPGDIPKPSAPVKPDSLKKGERYWFVFASQHEYDKYNQGVIGFWPEKDAKAEALEAAVKVDAYRWHPQYEPQLKLSIGHLIEKGKWRVRAEKDAKVLWEVELPGKPTDWHYGLYLSPGGDLGVPAPKCGQYLVAETDTKLEKDNEFGLAAGPYYVSHGYDPETGKKLATWVRKPQGPGVALVNRAYDPDTGKATFEQRFDFLGAGGKAAGAKTENWYRKIERALDASGKVTKEQTFRYDESAEAGKRWVKVQ